MECRVLIVEDNRDIAESMTMLLEVNGFSVRAVHDGEEGIRALGVFRPQVALIDIGLPKATGYEVATWARRQFGMTIFLVAITGWATPQDVKNAMSAGFDMHFRKPADPDQLTALIDAACRDKLGEPA